MKAPSLLSTVAGLLLTGCGAGEQLSRLGKAPPLAPIELPPPARPAIAVAAAAPRASLFDAAQASLYRDPRAARVGDLVTVRVEVSDSAQLDNSTEHTRSGSSSMGVPTLFGLEKLLPNAVNAAKLFEGTSDSSNKGKGSAQRSEKIAAVIAARVVAIVDGGLLIRGRQQVRVNHELRDLMVEGIIRPEDIAADNSIRHTQIAEARISYGGRGTLSDIQQPKWGQQALEAISPF